MTLKGSRTEENLKAAFASEAQANRRYLYFAQKADVEGLSDVASVFRSTAEGETGHAHGHLEYLESCGDPVTGLPLGDVLNSMNRRIEYLVDRDHRIGHAFFIDCKTKADADAVMRDKVIPLLQEYFFDDWNRLAAVLGEKDKGGNFLTCEIIEDPMGEGGQPLRSWRVRPQFDEGAYTRLVSTRAASPTDLEDEA